MKPLCYEDYPPPRVCPLASIWNGPKSNVEGYRVRRARSALLTRRALREQVGHEASCADTFGHRRLRAQGVVRGHFRSTAAEATF
eukprot:2224267-Pyramimonas_sp.AAC.1